MNNLIQSKKHLEKMEEEKRQQKIKDEIFMEVAIKEAEKALLKGEVPVGAVIVKDDKIIAKAHNLKENKNCAIYHAEVMAIIKASKKLGWRLDGCTMYVTLEPCLMCGGAIVSSRIERLVYGAKEIKSGFFESNNEIYEKSGLNHKVAVESGVLSERCKEVLQRFFESRR